MKIFLTTKSNEMKLIDEILKKRGVFVFLTTMVLGITFMLSHNTIVFEFSLLGVSFLIGLLLTIRWVWKILDGDDPYDSRSTFYGILTFGMVAFILIAKSAPYIFGH